MVLLLWIIFVIYNLCLSWFPVFSLQPCVYLLRKSWPLGSIVCEILLFFVTLPCDVLGQVWYLIVLIPDLSFPTFFDRFALIFFVMSCGCFCYLSRSHGALVSLLRVIVTFPCHALLFFKKHIITTVISLIEIHYSVWSRKVTWSYWHVFHFSMQIFSGGRAKINDS